MPCRPHPERLAERALTLARSPARSKKDRRNVDRVADLWWAALCDENAHLAARCERAMRAYYYGGESMRNAMTREGL